jgi:hypothetical protein
MLSVGARQPDLAKNARVFAVLSAGAVAETADMAPIQAELRKEAFTMVCDYRCKIDAASPLPSAGNVFRLYRSAGVWVT